MNIFNLRSRIFRHDPSASSELGNGWRLIFRNVETAENNGTGVGVFRKDQTPDVERQSLHYLKGRVAVRLGDMMLVDGNLYRLGSPYDCRGHHVEVTSERIGEMRSATIKRRTRDYYDTPTDAIAHEWQVEGLLAAKRHREATVGGTGQAVKPIKTFTLFTLPEGMDKPRDGDIISVEGEPYTAIQSVEAVMNADFGLWTISLAEGAI